MNAFYYAGINPVAEYDSELERELAGCKTEEEKNEVVMEYASMRLMALGIAFLVLIVSVVIIGTVIYLFR